MPLFDEHGNSLSKGPGVKAGVDKRMDVEANVFEGVVQIKIYQDAIEAKGKCAHCNGMAEGVLKFPTGYLSTSADREERQLDAKRQVYEKLKKLHYCIPRIDGPKLPVADFLRRFE